MTGFTSFEYSLGGKWLELLKEIVPATRRVLVLLVQEHYTSRGLLRFIEAAGQTLGIKVTPVAVHEVSDIERVGANRAVGCLRRRISSLPITASAFLNWQPRIASPRFTHSDSSPSTVGWSPTVPWKLMHTGGLQPTSIAF